MDLLLIMIFALVLGAARRGVRHVRRRLARPVRRPARLAVAGRPRLIFARPMHRREPAGGTGRHGSRGRARLRDRPVARDGDGLTDGEPARLAGVQPKRPREQQAAALVHALEPGLGVRHGLDRAPPRVGGRLGHARDRDPDPVVAVADRLDARRLAAPVVRRAGAVDVVPRRRVAAAAEQVDRQLEADAAVDRLGPAVVELEVDDELGRHPVAEEADRLAHRDPLARDRPLARQRDLARRQVVDGEVAVAQVAELRLGGRSRTPRASCRRAGTGRGPSAARGRRRTAGPRGPPP